MRVSRLFHTVACGAILALTVTATAAADSSNPTTPVVSQGSGSTTVVPQGTSGHPNVSVSIRLTDVVKDGKDTHFRVTVTNAGKSAINFGRLAIEGSPDGNVADSWYGVAKGLTRPGNNAVVPYVDKMKFWIQIGTLRPGQPFTATGQFHVPDRDNPGLTWAAGNRLVQNATFMCLAAHYVAMKPGQTKPGLERRSQPACAQYTVS